MDSTVDILLIIEADITTTQLVEQILDACAAKGLRTTKRRLDDLTIGDFGSTTIPLFVRCGDPYSRAWTDALSAANRLYVYYIDDNFWHIVGSSLLAAYYRHPLVRRSLESNIAKACTVIAGSSELAQFLVRLNSHVVALPTFADFSLIDATPLPKPCSELRIGFAGSASRGDDLDLISPIIQRTLERHPKVVFEFVGAFPSGIPISERVRRFPHVESYAAYIRWQRERDWTIALAPLADHAANRSKTDNKYREYGAFGYAGIYSAIPPYSHVVTPGETGLLVENTPDAWFTALDDLLTSPAKRETIARQASADVRARYDIARVSDSWAQAFRDVADALRPDAKAIDENQLRHRLRRAFAERWRLHVALRYHEGGVALVARGAVRLVAGRLARLLRPV